MTTLITAWVMGFVCGWLAGLTVAGATKPRHPHSPMPGPTKPKPPLYGSHPRTSHAVPNPPPREP
jgi:hypothetical protein